MQAAGKDKKEKKEKKEKKLRSSSAGKAVSAVGKFFQAARRSQSNGDTPGIDEVASHGRGSGTSPCLTRGSTGTTLQSETSSLLYSSISERTEGTLGSRHGRPIAIPCGATTSVEPFSKQIEQVMLLSKQASGKSSSKVPGQLLTASQPVEDFLAQGLLSMPSEGLLQVNADETIGSVVEKLYRWKLFSCIVSVGTDKKEFFDCMDLACYLLEVVTNAGDVIESEDWVESKLKLQKVAEAPVQDALKAPRGTSEFKRFDAEGSFLDLLALFASYKRVPIYRHGELCRVITAADILEMCNCVSEETLVCLEGTRLAEMMQHWPGMLSRIRVHEDFGMLEVLQTIRDGNVNAVPVVEGGKYQSARSDANSGKVGHRMSKQSLESLSVNSEDSDGVARTLVGQFDIAALRVMLVHNASDAGAWWWEDESLNKNILFEPCMDFISLSSAVVVSQSASAPFSMIQAEETLARTIARLLASTYHSVVVYPSGGQGNSARGDAGESLDGLLSSIALVVTMMQAGVFDVLSWDPSKPRYDTAELVSGKRSRTRSVGTKSGEPDSLVNQITDENEGGRITKVKFCTVIELEWLDVPTCPEHGFRHLKFTAVQDGEGKYAMDFRTLRDLHDDSKVGGATAQCNACMKSLGRVTLRQREVPSPSIPATADSSGHLTEASGSWFDIFFARNISASSSSTSLRSRTVVSSPVPRSALKRGTAAPLKKSKTAERLVAIRDKQSESQPARGNSFFGLCCSPCRVQEKDQIQTSMRIVGGPECSREDGEGQRAPDSPLLAPHRSSRQGSNSVPSSERAYSKGRRDSKGQEAPRDAKDYSMKKVNSEPAISERQRAPDSALFASHRSSRQGSNSVPSSERAYSKGRRESKEEEAPRDAKDYSMKKVNSEPAISSALSSNAKKR